MFCIQPRLQCSFASPAPCPSCSIPPQTSWRLVGLFLENYLHLGLRRISRYLKPHASTRHVPCRASNHQSCGQIQAEPSRRACCVPLYHAPSPSCHALIDKPKSPSVLRRLTLRLHLLFCSRVPGFILHNQGQSPDCSHDVHVLTTSTRAQHRPAIPLSIDAGADVVVQSALLRARVLWVPRIRPAFPIPTSPARLVHFNQTIPVTCGCLSGCHSGSKPFAIVCPHRYTWNRLLLPLNLSLLFFLSSLLISFKPVAAKYCPVVRPCRPMRKVLDL